MIEGKKKAQDHEVEKPFDSGVIGSDVIWSMIACWINYGYMSAVLPPA
jgi:hypothetical protein